MSLLIPANGWKPRPHQFKFWSALEQGKRRAIEVAHRRWGKDEIALNWAAVASMERVGGYWHMLPEYAQARKAIWTAVNPHSGKRRIDEAFPQEIRDSTNEQEMFIRFKTGSTWQVIGSDNYDRLVGVSIAGLTASEWALANPSAWGYLAPIVAENNGWAIFITTPRGKNHAYSMLNMARKSSDWFSEVSTVADTGAISLEIVEQQRAEYHALYGEEAGDALIEQEFYCSFEAAILGAYYGKEMAKASTEGRIRVVDPHPDYPLHTAWDLGIRDSTVIWFWQALPGQIVRVVGCYAATGYGILHYAEVIKEFAARLKVQPGDDFVPHDARQREFGSYVDNPIDPRHGQAKQRIEVMLECGLNPRKVADHTLMDGISAVRQLLPKCEFDEEGCGDGLEGLRQYRTEWDDETKIFNDKPKHDWASHYADGFRTLAMAYREVHAIKPKEAPRGLVVAGGKPPPGWKMPTYADILQAQADEPKRRERI